MLIKEDEEGDTSSVLGRVEAEVEDFGVSMPKATLGV